MNIKKTIFSIFALLFSTVILGQWTNLLPSSNYSFEEVVFPTDSVGYSIGNSGSPTSMYKTQDAGVSWQKLFLDFSPITQINLRALHFPTNETGYIMFQGYDPSIYRSFLYKTIDGGQNWIDKTPTDLPTGSVLTDVYFIDANNGYVVLEDTIYKTTNGGDIWTKSFLTEVPVLTAVDFFDIDNGIAAGSWGGRFDYKGVIYTTDDGGVSWNSLSIDPKYTSINRVDYAGTNTAYALSRVGVRNNQQIYKTVDAGLNWDTINLKLANTDQALDMKFVNENEGYLSTNDGKIYFTSNGGINWSIDHSSSVTVLKNIALSNKSIYVGGPLSTLLTKSIDAATSVGQGIKKDSNSNIYPNPNTTKGVLNFKIAFTGEIRLINSLGKIIYEEQLTSVKKIELSKIKLSPGIYFLNMIGEKNIVQKVLIN